MPDSLPRQLRLLLLYDQWVSRFKRFVELFRDEMIWAWIPPLRREEITSKMYDRELTYRPGGKIFEGGLFNWEREIFEKSSFPKEGTILIGGAGAGRELKALTGLNYKIIAFEPAPRLFEELKKVAIAQPGAVVFQASYRDFEKNSAFSSSSIDGVILGWGSFNHLTDEGERETLLKTLRQIAPKAPVLISFFVRETIPEGKRLVLRRLLRKMNRLLGAPSEAGVGDIFHPEAGFAHQFSPDEIKTLALEAGYVVEKGDLIPYPHALLIPK